MTMTADHDPAEHDSAEHNPAEHDAAEQDPATMQVEESCSQNPGACHTRRDT